jgi:hypothetical protein
MKHGKKTGVCMGVATLKDFFEILQKDGHHSLRHTFYNLVAAGSRVYTTELEYAASLKTKKELQETLDTFAVRLPAFLKECRQHKLAFNNSHETLSAKALHDFFLHRRDEGYNESLRRHLEKTS